MKKAFSLIEIMQTIVLLGIIAGLSISFFKKINTNDKLYVSTERLLTAAIQEANRQMCSDETPTCAGNINGQFSVIPYDTINQGDANRQCSDVYANSVYNSTLKYCIVSPAPVAGCPAPEQQRGNIGQPNEWISDYDEMRIATNSDGTRYCYANPPCPNRNSIPDSYSLGAPGNVYNYDTSSFKAVPFSSYACFNNKPNYLAFKTVNGDNIRVLCYYLHSILMHKSQGADAGNDLQITCGLNVPFTDNANITPATITQMVNDVADAVNRDNYNMFLPNGVYLYNLGASFPNYNNANAINIYIKYDRVPSSRSARYVVDGGNMDIKRSTIGAMRVSNPSESEP